MYEKRFPFYRIAGKAIRYTWPAKFKKVSNYYIRKAGFK